jgi:long-chain acyl-CoA synthetase
MPLHTAVSPDTLPLQSLYRWERERPQDIYMSQPSNGGQVQNITWAEAADQVRRMATWIKAQGWPEGSRLAILGKNSAHWILSDLAILMAGHVSVPIYPTFNAEALSYILEHSDCKACFVGKMDDVSHLLRGVPAGVVLVALPLAPAIPGLQWDAIQSQNQPLKGNPVRPAESLCTIIYTSGTTGKPKGVMHTFEAMAWGLSSAGERLPMYREDRLISYLPLAHVAERMLIEQASLRYGSHVFFAEALDTFLQDLQRARPTVFFSVPRLWVKFQQGVHSKMPAHKLQTLLKIPLLGGIVRRKILKGLGLDQCRIAAGGAAPMPADVLQWYRKLGLDLIEVYGMTENCGISHSTLPGSRQVGSVGKTYYGVEGRIAPDSGEIQMRSPAVMQGYYREPQQTADAMTADGWLRTGDKGKIDAQGFLSITGRVKDIFKTSKGKYVAPAPIEDKLVVHPDIEACAVTGANFAQPFALVMLAPESAAKYATADGKKAFEISLAAHLTMVNSQLEPHEKLDCLAVVTTPWTPENGLVTPTLKVKRPQIEEAYGRQYESLLAHGKPVVWVKA